jgi:hypothetical protein
LKKHSLTGVIVLIAVATLVYVGIGFHQYYKDLEKYCGIRIYDDRNEVLYRLGFPAAVLDDSQKSGKYPGRRSYKTNRKAAGDDPDKMMPEGKTVADYYEWSYPFKGAGNVSADVYVDFDRATKAIENIDCVDFTDSPHLCPSLAGIAVGDTEDRVRDKLGKPDRYELDGVTKTLSYDGAGIEFRLTKGSVYYLRLSNSNGRNQLQLLYLYLRSLFE